MFNLQEVRDSAVQAREWARHKVNAVVATALVLPVLAHAQETDPFTAAMTEATTKVSTYAAALVGLGAVAGVQHGEREARVVVLPARQRLRRGIGLVGGLAGGRDQHDTGAFRTAGELQEAVVDAFRQLAAAAEDAGAGEAARVDRR